MPELRWRAQPWKPFGSGVGVHVGMNPALGAVRADPWFKAQESDPCSIFQCLNKKAVFLPAVCIIMILFTSANMSNCFRRFLLFNYLFFPCFSVAVFDSVYTYFSNAAICLWTKLVAKMKNGIKKGEYKCLKYTLVTLNRK